MAMVNIPRGREDPNYRYKMPRLSSKIEGRGNGIKTNIANMGEIARALRRPPMYPTKFFGCELGAQAKFEEAEEKALINGAHTEKDLVVILDKFIEMYVLCPNCKLPESDILAKRGGLVSKCNACGSLSNLDIAHKAATYMIRNPPSQSSSTMGGKEKKQREKAMRGLHLSHSKESILDSDGDDEAPEKLKKKKDKRMSKDKKVKKKKGSGNSDDESNLPDLSDLNEGAAKDADNHTPSEEKKKKKKKKKSAEEEKLIENESLTYESPEMVDVIERLKSFMLSSGVITPESFSKELRMLQVTQDFDSKCRVYVGLCVLFGSCLTPEQLDVKIPLVKKLKNSSVSPANFFDALEFYCCIVSSSPLMKYPYIVQALYNAEILDAENILEHYEADTTDSQNFLKCQEIIQPFLSWLKENDSEEEYDATESSTPNDEGLGSRGAGAPVGVCTLQQPPSNFKPLHLSRSSSSNSSRLLNNITIDGAKSTANLASGGASKTTHKESASSMNTSTDKAAFLNGSLKEFESLADDSPDDDAFHDAINGNEEDEEAEDGEESEIDVDEI